MHNLEKLVLGIENQIEKIKNENNNLIEKEKVVKLLKLKNKIKILFENNLVVLINTLDYIEKNEISDDEAIDIILGLDDNANHYKTYKNMRDLR